MRVLPSISRPKDRRWPCRSCWDCRRRPKCDCRRRWRSALLRRITSSGSIRRAPADRAATHSHRRQRSAGRLPDADEAAADHDRVGANRHLDRARRVSARDAQPVATAIRVDTIMVAPSFPQPMYEPLRDLSQDLLLPGLDAVPPDTVLGLETNRRFVEALHGRPQLRDGARAVVARLPDRPARHLFRAVLGRRRRRDINPTAPVGQPRARRRHRPDRRARSS